MNPVTEALIWGTIGSALARSLTRTWTSSPLASASWRRSTVRSSTSPPGWQGKQDWYLSDEDFIAHIGLVCNVTNETRAKWAAADLQQQADEHHRGVARNFRHERAKAKAAA